MIPVVEMMMPASAADIRLARLPAISALMPSRAIIGRWLGARPPVTAIWIAIELKLANPHSEKVTTATVYGDSVALDRAEFDERDEFVEHDLGAEQAARLARLGHGHAEHQHDRLEDIADERWKLRSGIAEPAADPAEQPVGERDERDEGEHHCADRDRQLDAGLRALRGGHDDVGGPFLVVARLGELDRLASPMSSGSSGIMILAIRMPPGADMKLAASR